MSNVALKTEQEAQNLQNQERATIYDIAKGKTKYRKQFIAFEKIERANKPKKPTAVTSVVGGHGVNLVSVVAQKLRGKRREFIANLNYIATITGKKRRQNINIINQINGTAFNVTSYKKYKNHRNCYVFRHLEKTIKIDESKVQNFAQLESLQTIESSQKQGYYKNNNTESIRSNVHAHESNFLQNTQEISQEENPKPQIVELPKEPVKPAKLKKRLANKRKKRTNTKRKARIYHFNQYSESQDLKHHYPLTKEDGDKLQSLSGRDFSLNAMNEILLDMSMRRDNRFCSKAQFMAYFGTCLKYEKRDAVKTGNDNFRIKANVTPINQKEIDKEKQIEQYLAEVEQKAITHVCPENQLKSRIANVLEPLKSYALLSNIKDFAVIGSIVRIYLRANCQLIGHEKDIVLSQVKSIYSTHEVNIESVEYLVENACRQVNGYDEVRTKGTPVMPTLQQGIWGDICRKLIEIYGIHIYNNWFSKLTPIIDEEAKTIELKAPNLFVKQWVETNYWDTIQETSKKLGFDLKVV